MAFTFFFRDLQVLDQAVQQVLPLMAGSQRPVIWDAGAAMGPEPYTLAFLLAEAMNPFAFRNLRIIASDIDENNQFGSTILTGRYPFELLERIPEPVFKKYFERTGEGTGTDEVFCVISKIRERIHFVRHDLTSLQPVADGVAMVVCKNVLLHLQHSERVEVIRMFHRALIPGGILAMEQTQKLPDELAHLFMRTAADAQVFRRLEAA